MNGDSQHDDRDTDLRRRLAELPEPAPADAALRRRVLEVPTQYPRGTSWLQRLRDGVPELGRWLSTPALAGQAAVLVLALAAGMWAGSSADPQQVDMSDWALVLATDDYEEELP